MTTDTTSDLHAEQAELIDALRVAFGPGAMAGRAFGTGFVAVGGYGSPVQVRAEVSLHTYPVEFEVKVARRHAPALARFLGALLIEPDD